MSERQVRAFQSGERDLRSLRYGLPGKALNRRSPNGYLDYFDVSFW